MAVNARWGALRSFATALRTAARPGSAGLGTRLAALPRLVRATLRGEYTGTARSTLFMMAAGVAYVVSPFDLVPEAFLALVGLGDDAVVLAWLASAVVNETETFLAWEKMRPKKSREDTARGETVESTVVG